MKNSAEWRRLRGQLGFVLLFEFRRRGRAANRQGRGLLDSAEEPKILCRLKTYSQPFSA
jgi:hypothetical protein